MSYDFDLRLKPCDHLQLKERMVVSTADFRTLLFADRQEERMRGPITAQGSVKLFISGVEVPRGHASLGWDIQPDELSAKSEQKSKIVFRLPMRLTNPLIQVQYVTSAPYCLKCNGYSKTNDYQIDQAGAFLHITEYNKLVLRIYKFLLTSKCAFYPSFTSRLKDFVGRKFGGSLTEEDITFECVNCLDNLKRIQIAQKGVQFLSPQEILKDIESITTKRDTYDPTIVQTKMLVSSFGVPRPTPLAFTIRTNKG
jgi:hypothetical protein